MATGNDPGVELLARRTPRSLSRKRSVGGSVRVQITNPGCGLKIWHSKVIRCTVLPISKRSLLVVSLVRYSWRTGRPMHSLWLLRLLQPWFQLLAWSQLRKAASDIQSCPATTSLVLQHHTDHLIVGTRRYRPSRQPTPGSFPLSSKKLLT